MRKVAISAILIVVLLGGAAIFSGCGITAPGEVISEEKAFSGFTYVDVGSAFEVEITRSDSFSVVIRADESLFDYVEVSMSGSTLKIYLAPHHIFTDFTIGAKTLKAEITMPYLNGLQLSGASKGEITGFKSSGDFDLVVSGASSLKTVDMEVGDAELEVSGASKISGNLTADDVRFTVSGASTAELSGLADDVILEVSGASRADLTDFLANNVDVEVSGASEATVNVKEGLDVVVSGASRLYFLGNPTLGETEVSGASTIKHK